MIAPALRSAVTEGASSNGIEEFNAADPAVVGIPAKSKLSFSRIGMQNKEPVTLSQLRAWSCWSASSSAPGFREIIALIAGLCISILARKDETTSRHVFCLVNKAVWIDDMVASRASNWLVCATTKVSNVTTRLANNLMLVIDNIEVKMLAHLVHKSRHRSKADTNSASMSDGKQFSTLNETNLGTSPLGSLLWEGISSTLSRELLLLKAFEPGGQIRTTKSYNF